MQKYFRAIGIVVLALRMTSVSAGNALFPDTILYMNQGIVSAGKRYSLIMQPDGNLVMYRSNGSARWATNTHGWYAIMQGDGNFVVYNSSYSPLFNTGTGGHRGATLAIQDDGNLVVYGPDGHPLWWIGSEPTPNDPKIIADLVGRDLDVPGLGPIGHIGIADGSNVLQATSFSQAANNAAEITSLDEFKRASSYWGAASPNIPSDWQERQCYLRQCNYPSEFISVLTRMAIISRAYQITLIGADYTIWPLDTVPAVAGFVDRPPSRGVYRCDTYVLDAYHAGTHPLTLSEQNQKWARLITRLRSGGTPILPSTVFAEIKNFR